ncbi:hypothetical protein [Dongshaea marina]|uniref:hypothetical protein n=1 Tax=Dongshaea marina TaxID=2047966 RepID=UPI00131F2DD6|nr:hypothetical protein [Dongshaea marina]
MSLLARVCVVSFMSTVSLIAYAGCSCEYNPPGILLPCEENLSASGFPEYYTIPDSAGYNEGFSDSVSGQLHLRMFVEDSGSISCSTANGGTPGFTAYCNPNSITVSSEKGHSCCTCDYDVTVTYRQASRASLESGLDDSDRDYETRYGENGKFPDFSASAFSAGHIGDGGRPGNAHVILSKGPSKESIVDPLK